MLRVAFIGGLLLILMLAYLGATDGVRGTVSVARRVQQQNELGQIFFVCFSVFSAGAMAMAGPVLTCTAISSERLHKTLHVLLMTPITAWQIVTGKLFSRLLIALTLIGLSLPVLALVRLLGGVEIDQMFGALALCASVALLGATTGLLVSTFVNRAYVAILFSYAFLLLLWIFVPIFVMVPYMSSPAPAMSALHAVCIISPLVNVVMLASPLSMTIGRDWVWCVGAQTALAAAMVALSALAVRRVARKEGSPAEAGAASAPDQPELTNPFDPDQTLVKPHQPRRVRHVGDNPVLWREVGRPLFARRWQSIAAGGGFIILLLISYAVFHSVDALRHKELQIAYACVFNGLAWLVLGVLSATAIAQEKESDTWTLLLATPISGRRVVIGKILGIYRRMLWPVLIVGGHFAIFALAGVISWQAIVMAIWVMLTFNALWVATGVYLSMITRTVTFAVIINLLLAIGLYAAVPILLAIVGELTDPRVRWAEQSFWTSPYYYVSMVLERCSPDYDPDRRFWGPGMDGMARVSTLRNVVIASGIGYLLLSSGIVLLLLNRFNGLVGRAAQSDPYADSPKRITPEISIT